MRKRREKLKDSNICMTCLKRERIEGLKSCGVCAEKNSERRSAYREKNRIEGKCTRCPEQTADGRTLCERHLYEKRKHQRAYMSRRRTANSADANSIQPSPASSGSENAQLP